MRINPRKRLQREKPEPLAVPEAPNEVWSMDFVADQLADGRSFRTPNQVISWRDSPLAIRVDNDPEFVSARLQTCAKKAGIGLIYIQPAKP